MTIVNYIFYIIQQLLGIFFALALAQCEKIDDSKNLALYKKLVPQPYCPDVHDHYNYTCDSYYPYRTFDGSCNNLFTSWFGKVNTPYNRILLPVYDDGVQSLKTKSVLKYATLPNAREVSIAIHSPVSSYAEPTQLFVFFGQHLFHDMIESASMDPRPDCECGVMTNGCINIDIPEYDPDFSDKECLTLSRMGDIGQRLDFRCTLPYRQQFSENTAWVDLDLIYGRNEEDAKNLRVYGYGLLKTSSTEYGRTDLPLKESCPVADSNSCYELADVGPSIS